MIGCHVTGIGTGDFVLLRVRLSQTPNCFFLSFDLARRIEGLTLLSW